MTDKLQEKLNSKWKMRKRKANANKKKYSFVIGKKTFRSFSEQDTELM